MINFELLYTIDCNELFYILFQYNLLYKLQNYI